MFLESFLEEISKTFCGSIDSKINIENRSGRYHF